MRTKIEKAVKVLTYTLIVVVLIGFGAQYGCWSFIVIGSFFIGKHY